MEAFENKILRLANKAGRIALANGAETYRVENIICRICKYYNLDVQCFVSITGIITSITTKKGENFCSVERIAARTTNLNKVHLLNNILRQLETYNSYEDLLAALEEVDKNVSYGKLTTFFGYCLAAFSFAILFNGNLKDGIGALIGGGLVFIISDIAIKLQSNSFFLNTLGGFLCTLCAYFAVKVGLTNTMSYTTIGTIMLLVPGIPLTNAIRDLVAGDLLAGVSRATEAFLVGAALACGTGFALYMIF